MFMELDMNFLSRIFSRKRKNPDIIINCQLGGLVKRSQERLEKTKDDEAPYKIEAPGTVIIVMDGRRINPDWNNGTGTLKS